MDDLKNVGESNYSPGDGTDQRVQFLVFMMMMIIEKSGLRLLMVINPFVSFNNILSAAQIRLPLTVAAYHRPTAKQSILALMTVKT